MQIISILTNEVRQTAANDWVIFTLLGCICALIFTLLYLNRDAGLRDFFLQEYEDAANATSSWTIISIVFCILLAVLLSQFVPIVPKFISENGFFGLTLNKFGFTLLSVFGMMAITTVLSFFFFMSADAGKNRERYFFYITKYYLAASLALIPGIISYYYFSIFRERALLIYSCTLAFLLILKIIYLAFSKIGILPGAWYYKILYICTLQIAPALVLWRVLFL